jgi:hypothetical protein
VRRQPNAVEGHTEACHSPDLNAFSTTVHFAFEDARGGIGSYQAHPKNAKPDPALAAVPAFPDRPLSARSSEKGTLSQLADKFLAARSRNRCPHRCHSDGSADAAHPWIFRLVGAMKLAHRCHCEALPVGLTSATDRKLRRFQGSRALSPRFFGGGNLGPNFRFHRAGRTKVQEPATLTLGLLHEWKAQKTSADGAAGEVPKTKLTGMWSALHGSVSKLRTDLSLRKTGCE